MKEESESSIVFTPMSTDELFSEEVNKLVLILKGEMKTTDISKTVSLSEKKRKYMESQRNQ